MKNKGGDIHNLFDTSVHLALNPQNIMVEKKEFTCNNSKHKEDAYRQMRQQRETDTSIFE